jgi:glycine/D-amino acid oxidase-like deaminating enzyme
MTESADVVVIGGGIHGASTAFHLARRGANVIVLEAHTAASGATGRSNGFVRMHYDLAVESALAWHSFDYFTKWADLVGEGDCGFVETGFLRIVGPDKAESLRANVADQLALGIDTCIVSADEAGQILPGLVNDDFDVAAYEPRSGYADPTGACAGFLAAARKHGATVFQGRPASAIEVDGGHVTGVRTASGRIATSNVVLAAGAWSAPLAATAGVKIELRSWHHDTSFVTRPAAVGGRLPVVIDDINVLYFRPEGEKLALVGTEDGNRFDEHPDDDTLSDPDVINKIVDRLPKRLPALAEGGFHSRYGGTDGMTPDQRAILGTYSVDGLILQCGMSGTGFKTAPAIGLAISELVLDGSSHTLDIAAFDPGRFAAGKPLTADHPYGDLWHS